MSDFRSELYSRYVSSFKMTSSRLDDSIVKRYWVWCTHKYLPLINMIDRLQPILDLGCGPGYVMEFLQNQGFTHIEGVDISAEQVAIAVERGLNAKIADALTFLNAKQNTFGLIMALDFVEHFSKEELFPMFAAIYASLQPGGVLFIQTPNGRGLFPNQVIYDDLTHMTIFTPDSLQNILKITGFHQFGFHETGPAPSNFKGIIRVGLWWVIKCIANAVRLIETNKTQNVWTENLICICYKPQ
ncbi:MAG: class I SAM-dependent methyltransferase [Anaerolineae bacterium]|nr:class I SAM-dependent methyltransferase [Anaerolineae bacterium]